MFNISYLKREKFSFLFRFWFSVGIFILSLIFFSGFFMTISEFLTSLIHHEDGPFFNFMDTMIGYLFALPLILVPSMILFLLTAAILIPERKIKKVIF